MTAVDGLAVAGLLISVGMMGDGWAAAAAMPNKLSLAGVGAGEGGGAGDGGTGVRERVGVDGLGPVVVCVVLRVLALSAIVPVVLDGLTDLVG